MSGVDAAAGDSKQAASHEHQQKRPSSCRSLHGDNNKISKRGEKITSAEFQRLRIFVNTNGNI
jgi:DNA-binding response OmpR family regulator